jgi:hypothetical protein
MTIERLMLVRWWLRPQYLLEQSPWDGDLGHLEGARCGENNVAATTSQGTLKAG